MAWTHGVHHCSHHVMRFMLHSIRSWLWMAQVQIVQNGQIIVNFLVDVWNPSKLYCVIISVRHYVYFFLYIYIHIYKGIGQSPRHIRFYKQECLAIITGQVTTTDVLVQQQWSQSHSRLVLHTVYKPVSEEVCILSLLFCRCRNRCQNESII